MRTRFFVDGVFGGVGRPHCGIFSLGIEYEAGIGDVEEFEMSKAD